jgi:propionyl-CoA carboxylase alpha chain
MGSKIEAKRLMADAGVPVLPELDPAAVTERDLPVLVKASAGGGGRGMRVVRALDELPRAVESARAEAERAFGDPTVFCEPYVEAGRHIEVQVLADAHGTVWSLGERECSLQRRHQKVVEETPSPMVDDTLRAELSAAAVAAARAIDYVGAGTVEFLARGSASSHPPDFWFLETNTRLQVEHPVTECVTGLDLVAEQLRVAAGERLPGTPPTPSGAAIEARLYAEDPAAGWRPRSGTVRRFAVPAADVEFDLPVRPGVRLDAGVVDGSVIGISYDPMLAKVIAWAPTRAEAAARLAGALAGARVHGPITNRDLLVRTLRHPEFLAGRTDTAFFDRVGLDSLAAPLAGPDEIGLAALAAALAGAAGRRRGARVLGELPSGWRNVPSQPQRAVYARGDDVVEVGYRHARHGVVVEGRDDVVVVSATPDEVVLEVAGVEHRLIASRDGDTVDVDGEGWAVSLRALPRHPDAATVVAEGSLVAPMPGHRRGRARDRGGEGDGRPAAAGARGDEDAAPRCGSRFGRGGVVGRPRRRPGGGRCGAGRDRDRGARVTLDFDEGDELRALRAAVADLGSRYGQSYFLEQARSGGSTEALWQEAGKAGFLGVNLPEEYGGGGGGLVELSLVCEELGAAGCGLLMMVVSPAICGTVIARFGTDEQKQRWLPAWPTARRSWRSPSPSPTPARTPTRSPPRPGGRATGGCSAAARPGSAGWTWPTRCSSSASSRTRPRARCAPRCSSSRRTPRA